MLEGMDGAASPFRPGMSAKVDVLTRRANAAVSVPIQAVTTRERDGGDGDDSELGVFILTEDETVQWQAVETGIQDNRNIEIQSGLDTTMRVITGPYQSVSRTLKDGDSVEIKDSKTDVDA
jgi:HlyD family secretion protein